MWSPEQLVRQHLQHGLIPKRIYHDVKAFKRVLRDWIHVVEADPLQAKQSYPALLELEVRHVPKAPTLEQHRLSHPVESSSCSLPSFTTTTPMKLWLSLLPWEVQRGLSKAELTLPAVEPREADSSHHSIVSQDKKREQTKHEQEKKHKEEEEEDELGIVFSHSSSTSVAPSPTVPGMLFILDLPGVRARRGEVNFWSGAIQSSIDVLFFRPLPTDCYHASCGVWQVNGSSTAPPQQICPPQPASPPASPLYPLQAHDHRERLKAGESPFSPRVANTFFPAGDLELLRTGPHPAATTAVSPLITLQLHEASYLDPFLTAGEEEGNEVSKRRTVTGTSTNGGPFSHYVLECPRHTLKQAIEAALQRAKIKTNGVSTVHVHASLKLSAELEQAMISRAQVYCEYCAALEEAMGKHLKEMMMAGMKMECDSGTDLEELVEEVEDENDRVSTLVPASSSFSLPSEDQRRPSRVGRSTDIQSIEDVSPALIEEAEGRPATYSPSFLHPLHHAAASSSTTVKSALQASRYPATHAAPWVDIRTSCGSPPLDYELLSAAFRLGIGLGSVQRWCYERLLMDWRVEVLRIRKEKKRKGEAVERASCISESDLQCFLSLVQDPSLQFPEELGALVEVVAEHRATE